MQKFFLILLVCLVSTIDPILPEHTLQVYGNASLGYYYVKIFVGYPPQQQTVIIDTGSGQLALPCNKCINCNLNHINRPFDMSKSKTSEYITCQSKDQNCRHCPNKNPTQSCTFTISYAQGSSLQGIVIKDTIQFQSLSEGEQIVTVFGCTTKQTNLFLKQQANGIFGLAPQRTSSLLEDLYQKHHTFSEQELQFSLCLSGNGGLMTIGNINKAIHASADSVKTTYSSHKNLYSLNDVKTISIGNAKIHEQSEKFGYFGIFIDSGSTFTYFPKNNFLIFKQALIKSCQKYPKLCEIAQGQSTQCFHLIGQDDILQMLEKIFPPVIIQIGESSISWRPQKYFLLRDRPNRQICLGVEALDRYLLGANWMVDRDIVFNLQNKTVQIFSNVSCQEKQNSRRYMSQYTEKVDGHIPLSYENSVQITVISQQKITAALKIILPILLITIGALGLIFILFRKIYRRNLKYHQRVSHIQIQQGANSLNI